jgi:hypothetical protein
MHGLEGLATKKGHKTLQAYTTGSASLICTVELEGAMAGVLAYFTALSRVGRSNNDMIRKASQLIACRSPLPVINLLEKLNLLELPMLVLLYIQYHGVLMCACYAPTCSEDKTPVIAVAKVVSLKREPGIATACMPINSNRPMSTGMLLCSR